MLELAILGLLKEQDLHGYELKKRLGETLGVASGVSFGSLYPALGRLERAGALRTVEPSTGGTPAERSTAAIPQTGSLGGELAAWRARGGSSRAAGTRAGGRTGRSRKVYAITATGETMFEELLAAEQGTGDDSRLFHLRLAFARYLSADARLGMLERRRAHLLDRLTRVGSGSRTNRRIDAYVRSLIEHDRESTEHDLTWVERLIAHERDGLRSPPAPVSSSAPEAAAALEPAAAPDAPAPDVARVRDRLPASFSLAPYSADRPVPASAVAGTERVTPRRGIAPPTLSGLRPGTTDIPRPEGLANQEESTR